MLAYQEGLCSTEFSFTNFSNSAILKIYMFKNIPFPLCQVNYFSSVTRDLPQSTLTPLVSTSNFENYPVVIPPLICMCTFIIQHSETSTHSIFTCISVVFFATLIAQFDFICINFGRKYIVIKLAPLRLRNSTQPESNERLAHVFCRPHYTILKQRFALRLQSFYRKAGKVII